MTEPLHGAHALDDGAASGELITSEVPATIPGAAIARAVVVASFLVWLLWDDSWHHAELVHEEGDDLSVVFECLRTCHR